MNLYKEFKEKKRLQLKEKLWKKNIYQVPEIDKVVVAMWIWNLATKKGIKDFSDLEENLKQITGQKPILVRAKKSVSNFKLREWMPVMLKVTLRKQKAYDFIERLSVYVLPRLRDFAGIDPRKIDKFWNLSIWFKDQTPFAEIHPDQIKIPQWIQVTIATTADNSEDAKVLLEKLWILFIKNK